MSAPQQASFSNTSKKAVHVKWAGKTIALGTFPAAEADEKCARAKALTRAWRSSMRPKPSRDWVMLELERLGVRVVSGRLGRKAGEEGDETPSQVDKKPVPMAMQASTQGLGPVDRSPSLGWGSSDADLSTLMARRNSSLGLSMLNDGRRGSLGSLGQVVGLDVEPSMPPHRPMVGGGAAAAFEASRHDHYSQKNPEQQRRSSSLGLGNLTGGALGSMGMSVNPNQHYEMLKLHHMNLLNEIQETTLMMNLYQQQQLQQQQQQLQQQAGADLSGDPQMALLLQNQGGMDSMFGLQQQRASLGLGGSFSGQSSMHMLQQQAQQHRDQQQMLQSSTGQSSGNQGLSQGATEASQDRTSDEQSADSGGSDSKRLNDDENGEEPALKRIKLEEAAGFKGRDSAKMASCINQSRRREERRITKLLTTGV